ANLFDGPLPFESLNLGKSILGKKKQEVVNGEAGGFEKGPSKKTENTPKPLPPWFTGEMQASKVTEQALRDRELEIHDSTNSIDPFLADGPLRPQKSGEVIDLDSPTAETQGVIEVDSSDNESEVEVIIGESKKIDSKLTETAANTKELNFGKQTMEPSISAKDPSDALLQEQKNSTQEAEQRAAIGTSDNEEPIEWDESDYEENQIQRTTGKETTASNWDKLHSRPASPKASSRSISPEFEDVEVATLPAKQPSLSPGVQFQPDSAPQLSNESIDAIAADQEDMYSDPEDEDLMRQLAIEAEEHARFASTLNAKSVAENAQDYETELRQLRNQQKKDRRDADEVTHIMVTECQQLLKLFGLPYVTAPMEAEAQCAELVSLGLVDGIVTDDSDIFLFGGTRVYKNMFNQAKFVECYLTSDLEKEYSLDRQKLIRVAHLLGSDYTEGLPSVGPVTALEIISDFEDLEAFTEWWNSVQMGQKLPAEDASNALRKKLRKTATKILLPNNFPDKRVDIAYLNPEVDSDPSPFEWGVPDLDALRSFLMATIGWSQERTDEVLVPVVKDMNRREIEGTQANITQFFGGGTGVGAKQNINGGNSGFAPRRRMEGKSKRMENALGKLQHQARRRTVDEVDDSRDAVIDTELLEPTGTTTDAANDESRPKKSRRSNTRKRVAPTGSESADDDENETYEAPKRGSKGGNRAKKGQRSETSADSDSGIPRNTLPSLDQFLYPITALAFVQTQSRLLLLAGEGPFLKLFDHGTNELLLTYGVFKEAVVHGISTYSQLDKNDEGPSATDIFIWGDRFFSSFELIEHRAKDRDRPFQICRISPEMLAEDWILDACFRRCEMPAVKDIFFVTAHNVVFSLRVSKNHADCSAELSYSLELTSSGQKSMLYSAHVQLCPDNDRLLVAVGTVLGEVIFWSFPVSEHFQGCEASYQNELHHRFVGHEGSVFGIRIFEPDGGDMKGKRLLASCSDDRTVRVWDVSDLDISNAEAKFDDTVRKGSAGCIAMVMGHASRIWGVKFLPGRDNQIYVLSAGEDSTSQLWRLESRSNKEHAKRDESGVTFILSHRMSFGYQFGKNLWATGVYQLCIGNYVICTGGADGRIVSYNFSLNDKAAAKSVMTSQWKMQDVAAQLSNSPPLVSTFEVVEQGAKKKEPYSYWIFKRLEGIWNISRTIRSALPTYPSGVFKGEASFKQRPPTNEGSRAEYLYIEQGKFATDQGLEFQASRSYVYRLEKDQDVVSAWFVKPDDNTVVDYLFHQLRFTDQDPRMSGAVDGGKGEKVFAEGYHLCVEDHYSPFYVFRIASRELMEWSLQYTVTGPQKDYVTYAQYFRSTEVAPQATQVSKNFPAKDKHSKTDDLKSKLAKGSIGADSMKTYVWLSSEAFVVTTSH
ncbi:MAG: hypothetical protein Q9214_003805, partial [Letrouitia sp. 1 TL-2023]